MVAIRNFFLLEALLTIWTMTQSIQAHRILVFVPDWSCGQTRTFVGLANVLAEDGHKVTLYWPKYHDLGTDCDIKTTNPNVETIRFRSLGNNNTDYDQWREEQLATMFHEASAGWWASTEHSMQRHEWLLEGCEHQLTHQPSGQQLTGNRFDLAVVATDDLCSLGHAELLGIKRRIWLSPGPLGDYAAWASQSLMSPVEIPGSFVCFGDRMRLPHKTQNLAAVAATTFIGANFLTANVDKLFAKHGRKIDVAQLAVDSQLVFVNADEMLDFPRPVLPKTVNIGNFDGCKVQPMSTNWQNLADNAKDGLIVISFGSMAKIDYMPSYWLEAIRKTCAKFPTYTFVWKYDKSNRTELASISNLKTAPWIPQRALLAHPKTKAFVTEGGYNSMLESAFYGVPMVVVPLIGDQPTNRRRAERQGIAIGISKAKFSKRKLVRALERLLGNETFAHNAKLLAIKLQKKPIDPKQLAVGWTRFLAEFGSGPQYRPVSADMNLFQYWLLDVYAMIIAISIMIAYLIYSICWCYYWRCFETSMRTKSRND